MDGNQITYNRAKLWQIGLFAFNNTATNFFLILMMYVQYYVNGIVGVAAATVGILLTGMRVFDAFTDPMIGFFIDKTNTKFGKFRPSMLIGYVIMSISVIILFNTNHLVPKSFSIIYFVLIYGIYIVGYTFQTACTKAAQACLTNDPKQRPLFTTFDGIYNILAFMGMNLAVTMYLEPKYGGFTQGFFDELITITIVIAGFFTAFAIIGIWKKDRTEFFGLGEKAPKVKFSDYVDVIKGNRAIQMLVVAASTDKLAGTAMGNSAVVVVIYGVLAGNFALSGTIGLITLVPTLLVLILGVQYARKMGQKQALVLFTWIPLVLSLALGALMWLGDMSALQGFSVFTVIYIVLLVLISGTRGVSGQICIPMIADCADYETYRTGKYVPGMMGTLFSFIDKLVSSLATTVVTVSLAMIGFSQALPTTSTPYSVPLHLVGIFLFVGLPILGWVCSLVAMKFYPLDKEKMEEIQAEIAKIKSEA